MRTGRLFILVAALAAVAVPPSPEPAWAQSRAARWHLTPDGFGPVRIGMTRAQVERALAIRLRGEPLDEGPDACVEMLAVTGRPGLVFMFEGRRLTRISARADSGITTPRGIAVGARAAEVRRAYGRDLQAETHHYLERPAEYLTFWVRLGQRGVRFETGMDRRVTVIHAGTSSIEYIEGCA
jgi:hypothetical protein